MTKNLKRMMRMIGLCATCWLVAAGMPSTALAEKLVVNLQYDPSITSSFTGRVYVMFSKSATRDLRDGPGWVNTEPFFTKDVVDWKPNTVLTIDDTANSFPAPMSTLEQAEWAVQAVMRINRDSPLLHNGPGTAYSQKVYRNMWGGDPEPVALQVEKVFREREWQESDRFKLVKIKSDLLSGFHHRDMYLRAAVVLPEKYETPADPEHPARVYPTMYWIGGFGSDHSHARGMEKAWNRTAHNEEIVRVVLDPLCWGGHHVFADSDNNGPVGTALVRELIPYLEKTFALAPEPNGRFLSGHSSGGWASLWLQIANPTFFGGTWSVAPDPVDFRDFQRINLYAPGANMYSDEHGQRRPLARHNDQVLVWYDTFAKMETVFGEGGQLRSFEWVFSPKGEDGLPMPLYDRTTGAIDPKVAETWKRYDIRMMLENEWASLGPMLGGKINVFAGEKDTFYLEGAVKLLKESLTKLGSDAVVEIVPGKDHTSVATPELRKRIDEELLAKFYTTHPRPATRPAETQPAEATAQPVGAAP